jgi:uncharacterized coiled-coil DUF342 family protein
MEQLIDRIENKIAELLQTNEQLREKVRSLSSERDQWVQECALHEQEHHNLNERLEKILSSLHEASKELALSQQQQHQPSLASHQHINLAQQHDEEILLDDESLTDLEEPSNHNHFGI